MEKINIDSGDIEVIETSDHTIYRNVDTGDIAAMYSKRKPDETPFIPQHLFERLESAENKLRKLKSTKEGLRLWNKHQDLIDKLEYKGLEWFKTGQVSEKTN